MENGYNSTYKIQRINNITYVIVLKKILMKINEYSFNSLKKI